MTSESNTQEPTRVLCPHCDGEGFFVYLGGPGYFCPSFGNYLPSESREPCSHCGGYGELDVWEDEPDSDSELDELDDLDLPF